jgi:hypothetical protein
MESRVFPVCCAYSVEFFTLPPYGRRVPAKGSRSIETVLSAALTPMRLNATRQRRVGATIVSILLIISFIDCACAVGMTSKEKSHIEQCQVSADYPDFRTAPEQSAHRRIERNLPRNSNDVWMIAFAWLLPCCRFEYRTRDRRIDVKRGHPLISR